MFFADVSTLIITDCKMEDISEFLDVNISCDTIDDAGKDTNSVGEKKHTAESSADNQQKSGDGDMNDSDGDRDGEKNKLCRIKSLCLRTDLSALAKVDQILQIIDSDGKDQTNNKKREAEEQLDRGDSSAPKQFKPDTDPEGEKAEDEDDDADCCVVCALPLRVFKEDNAKEVHHYLR